MSAAAEPRASWAAGAARPHVFGIAGSSMARNDSRRRGIGGCGDIRWSAGRLSGGTGDVDE